MFTNTDKEEGMGGGGVVTLWWEDVTLWWGGRGRARKQKLEFLEGLSAHTRERDSESTANVEEVREREGVRKG
jgi:hypothetical protein